MTPDSAMKLTLTRKLLLGVMALGALAGPILVGLVKAPLVNAESPQASAAPAPRNQIYHIGGGVSAPSLVFSTDPEYTEKARRAKYQGVCVVALIVDEQGNPQRVQVVRHLGMGLDKKAVEAVRQYRFKPAMLRGEPVAVTVNIEVNFKIY
jgi:TonB family protein